MEFAPLDRRASLDSRNRRYGCWGSATGSVFTFLYLTLIRFHGIKRLHFFRRRCAARSGAGFC